MRDFLRKLAHTALLVLIVAPAGPGSPRAQEITPDPGDSQHQPQLDPQVVRRAMYLRQHEQLWQGARARRERVLARRAAAAKPTAQAKPAAPAKARKGAKPTLLPTPPAAPTARRTTPLAREAAALIPANVRANEPGGESITATQSEISLAALGNEVLVSWNDGGDPAAGLQGYGTSSNGGTSFTDGGNLPAIPGWSFAQWRGDPVVTVDEAAARFYVAGLADVDHTTTTYGDSNALVIASRTRVGTWFWGSGRVIRALDDIDWFLDKEWIAADSSNGNVYVVYTLFNYAVDLNYIQFQRSTDGGFTWSSPYTLSAFGDAGDVQGSRIAVGPDGELHAIWMHNNPTTGLYDIRYRRSTNQGTSWSSQVTPFSYLPMSSSGPPGFNRSRAVNNPALAVDRSNGEFRGRVYIGYSEMYDHLDESWPAQPAASTVRFESESNNTSGTADVFTAGQTLRGASTSSDPDWWKVTLSSGQHLEFWADSTSTVSAVDYKLETYAPDATTQLAYSRMTLYSSGLSDAHWCIYAPVTGTYYLKVEKQESSSHGYRIRTRIGQTDGGFSRDRRDPFVVFSDDGSTWSSPNRITTGAVGSDDSFPELAVGEDGFVYATWLDARDDFYRAATCAYVGHSADGGDTWSQNARLSTVATDWTSTPVNLAPNMGDYVGLAPGQLRMHAAWPDGRGANVDVYTSSFSLTSGVQLCTSAQTAPAYGTIALDRMFQNGHDYATNVFTWQWTDTQGWLQFGLTFPFQLAPDEVITLPATVIVPGNAAQGSFDDVCLTVTNETGAIVRQCCTRITVSGTLLDVAAGGVEFGLRPVTPNPVASRATLRFGLPRAGSVSLEVYDVAGSRVRTLASGTLGAGEHSVMWDGRDDGGRRLGAGAYFVRLAHDGHEARQRVVLLR